MAVFLPNCQSTKFKSPPLFLAIQYVVNDVFQVNFALAKTYAINQFILIILLLSMPINLFQRTYYHYIVVVVFVVIVIVVIVVTTAVVVPIIHLLLWVISINFACLFLFCFSCMVCLLLLLLTACILVCAILALVYSITQVVLWDAPQLIHTWKLALRTVHLPCHS